MFVSVFVSVLVLLNCGFFSQTNCCCKSSPAFQKHLCPFSLVKCVCVCFHVQKMSFCPGKTLTSQNGVFCCCEFCSGKFTFLVSSCRLMQKIMELCSWIFYNNNNNNNKPWKSSRISRVKTKTFQIFRDLAFVFFIFSFFFFFFSIFFIFLFSLLFFILPCFSFLFLKHFSCF